MNKGLVLLILVLIVISGGTGFYLVNQRDEAKILGEEVISTPTPQKTVKDLLFFTKPVTCTFSLASDSNATEGIISIENGRMRGDIKDSHFLVDSGLVYYWTDVSDQGFKYALNEKPSEALDLDQKVDYDCQDWQVDEAIFTIPIGIIFQDLNLLGPCSACDKLPDKQTQTACLEQLNCQ